MSPLSSTSIDSLAGLFASNPATPPLQNATFALTADTTNNAMQWLATWLGQTAPTLPTADGTATPAALPKAIPDPSLAKQSQLWMTLLPSVPAYQTLVDVPALPPETQPAVIAQAPPSSPQPSPSVPLDSPMAIDAAVPLTVDSPPSEDPQDPEEPDKATENTDSPSLAPTPLPPPLIVIPAQPAPISIPSPSLDNDSEPAPERATNPTPLPDDTTPAAKPFAPAPLSQPQPDKGEVVWSADFVVKDAPKTKVEAQPTIQAGKAPATEVEQPTEPGAEIKIDRPGEVDAPAQNFRKFTQKERDNTQLPPPPQQPAGEQSPDAERENTQQHETGPEPPAPKSMPAKRERQSEPQLQPTEPEKPPSPAAAVSPRSSSVTPMPDIETAKSAPPTIGGTAEIEQAKPLRPTQIATLSVDVPAPGDSVGNPPMRLSVTQRGDQVNVRLRSWDTPAAPIDSDRMQPLLQSLADQGLTAENTTARIRLEDSGPILTESIKDKPLASAESPAGSNNDQQTSQNHDDRQQRNQERQQQAFFMRRQMRNLQSTAFDVRTVLDPNPQPGVR